MIEYETAENVVSSWTNLVEAQARLDRIVSFNGSNPSWKERIQSEKEDVAMCAVIYRDALKQLLGID